MYKLIISTLVLISLCLVGCTPKITYDCSSCKCQQQVDNCQNTCPKFNQNKQEK